MLSGAGVLMSAKSMMWYTINIFNHIGVSLEDVFDLNVDKLENRYAKKQRQEAFVANG